MRTIFAIPAMFVCRELSAKQFFHMALAKNQELYIWGFWSESTLISTLCLELSYTCVNSDPSVFLDLSFKKNLDAFYH